MEGYIDDYFGGLHDMMWNNNHEGSPCNDNDTVYDD